MTYQQRKRSEGGAAHSMSESFKEFCNFVSITAVNTNLMLLVSVVCSRLSELHYQLEP